MRRSLVLLLAFAACQAPGKPCDGVTCKPGFTCDESVGLCRQAMDMTPDAGPMIPDAGGCYMADAGSPTGPGVELNHGWIGGACSSAADCNDKAFTQTATCETTMFPGGFCTQTCDGTSCPDEAAVGSGGFATTRCIDVQGKAQCVAQCDFTQSPDTGCRPGYTCVVRTRFSQPAHNYSVCLPAATQTWSCEAPVVNDIGKACADSTGCASHVCLAMPNGYCSKDYCDIAGCPAGATCVGDSSGFAQCMKSCTQDSDCRSSEGYTCNTTNHTCTAPSGAGLWDSSVGPADCMAAWGTNGDKLSPCDTTKDRYVVVHKSKRNLALCNAGSMVASYRVGLGFAPMGDKQQQGDGKTPEGVFFAAEMNPMSTYYKAYLISWPDSAHAAAGLAAGYISSADKSAIDAAQAACMTPSQSTGMGGAIEIHGDGSSADWTVGCVALDNTNLDIVWSQLGLHDSIVILP
jgi:hypothetical protein